MTDLSGHGIAVALPAAWEGRIGLRQAFPARAPEVALSLDRSAIGQSGRAPGETFYPVTHLANFALPPDRGDFGSGAVDLMGPAHCLIALVEYGPDSVGSPLFVERRLPLPTAADFAPNTLQRKISGQSGCQRFCTVAGRAFCLYVVLGTWRAASPLSAAVRGVLAGVRIGSR